MANVKSKFRVLYLENDLDRMISFVRSASLLASSAASELA